VVLLIIQGVFSFFRVYIFSYVTENAMLALRRDAYSTIIRMPMQFFNERRVGDLSSRLSSDITTIQETLTTTMAEFIRQSVIIILFGALGLVMGVGAHLQDTGELQKDVLGKFVFITGLVAGSIGGLAAQMGTLQRSIGVIESVMEILSFKTEDIRLDDQPSLL